MVSGLKQKFMKSTTTDEQLSVLKEIFETLKSEIDIETVHFLGLVFLQAQPKHPVKCFLSR